MLEGGSALFEPSLSVMASYGLCPSQEQAPARRRLDIGVYNERLIGAVIDLHQSRRGSWLSGRGQSDVIYAYG
jgi:hypothetical protein